MARGSRHHIHRDEWEQRRTEFCARGESLPQAKLTAEIVSEIRSAKRQREALVKHIKEHLSNEALARRHGVHLRSIEKVVAHQTWCHVA